MLLRDYEKCYLGITKKMLLRDYKKFYLGITKNFRLWVCDHDSNQISVEFVHGEKRFNRFEMTLI